MLSGKGLLTPIQKGFIEAFARLPDQGQFYLTGGTALAEYYLGHRLSFDLDLFTAEESLILPVSYQVEKMGAANDLSIAVIRRFNSYVEFLVKQENESLKIDLALDSPFRLAPLEQAEIGIKVNAFLDIKADKLLAYFGRAEPRDAVDLYFILQSQSLEPLLEMASQKDPGFDLYWLAVALNRCASFPDEIERWPVKMLLPCNAIDIKQSFQKLALDLMQRLMGHTR